MGIIICTTCTGTSEVTEIAQICVQTTPNYAISYPENTDEKAKQIIDKYIISNNTDISNITRTELRQDEKRVVESYQNQMPFAKFSVSFDNQKFDWIVCGKNLLVEEGQDEMSQLFKAKRRAFILKIVLGIIAVLAVLWGISSFLNNDNKSSTPKQSSAQTQQSPQPKPQETQRLESTSSMQNSAQSTTEPSVESTASNESENVAQNSAQDDTPSESVNLTPSQNTKPSFDCAKASTNAEKIVCSDDELARLDNELANAYKNALNSLDNASKKQLTNEQKSWLKTYNQCTDKECVKYHLQMRIWAL